MYRKALVLAAAVSAVMIMTGCSGTKKENNENNIIKQTTGGETVEDRTQETTAEEKATTEETTAVAYRGPDAISFYQPDKTAGGRRLTKEFAGAWTAGKDILSLEVFASGEQKIAGNTFSVLWKEYWEKCEAPEDYRLGYLLEFDTQSEGRVERTILEPDDIYGFLDYIEVYIYDDVNVPPDTWYSHLLQEQVNENTYVTSIKLTAGSRIDEVSNIRVTAFVYKDEKDFDGAGRYIGTHSTECIVKRQ